MYAQTETERTQSFKNLGKNKILQNCGIPVKNNLLARFVESS